MNRKFSGVWIPKELILKYGVNVAFVVSGLKFERDIKAEFSRRLINNAVKLGLVETYKMTDSDIKAILAQKTPQMLAIGDKSCKWCRGQTVILDGHHINIKETEKICGCCHKEYHYLAQRKFYKLTAKAEGYYK